MMIKISNFGFGFALAVVASTGLLTTAHADQSREIQFGLKLNFKTVIKGDRGAVAGQGKLAGRLTDANGKPMAGVAVILRDGTGTYSEETRDDGGFAFPSLKPGPYEVTLGSGHLVGLAASDNGKTLVLASAALSAPRYVRFGFRFLF